MGRTTVLAEHRAGGGDTSRDPRVDRGRGAVASAGVRASDPVAATTGLRRAELCGLRRLRDLDLVGGVVTVSSTVVALPNVAVEEIPTKNRRVRTIALDDLAVSILAAQLESRTCSSA